VGGEETKKKKKKKRKKRKERKSHGDACGLLESESVSGYAKYTRVYAKKKIKSTGTQILDL
jgi:hypothetical protein